MSSKFQLIANDNSSCHASSPYLDNATGIRHCLGNNCELVIVTLLLCFDGLWAPRHTAPSQLRRHDEASPADGETAGTFRKLETLLCQTLNRQYTCLIFETDRAAQA